MIVFPDFSFSRLFDPKVILPILVGQLEILDRVRLNVNSKVGKVTEGVEHSKEEDESSNNFVKVDVVVKGKILSKAIISEKCDGVSQNKYDDNDGKSKNVLSCCPGKHVQHIWGKST